MKTIGRTTLILAALVAVSCGEKLDEVSQTIENAKTLAESANTMDAQQGAMEKRRSARRAAGDTLAMEPDKLKAFLPGAVDGYKASEPETQSFDMQGMSWSMASRTYTKDDNTSLKVTLTDYNASDAGWAGASAVFALKWSVDNANERQKTFQTGNDYIKGFERYGKQDHNASVTYSLGGRFLLQIEATGQSGTELVHSVATSMNLEKLASL